jgi:hypothetical protein
VLVALTAGMLAQQANPAPQTRVTRGCRRCSSQKRGSRQASNATSITTSSPIPILSCIVRFDLQQIQIAPTTPNNRQDPPNLWTGICDGPVAATLRDETALWI